ncbi:GNAT family N-acetyltransferase [Aurantimonas sp. A2-1-M11]|uniref:GNAT family N-acetyltransferase n=1 Tax=Aurantimonas sp. A2-1-M11 TaxID=3113712 RepID=UPI002F95A3FE
MFEDITAERDGETIETRRLHLGPLTMGDAGALAKLINDREIARMLARVPHPYALADARAYIRDHAPETVFALSLRTERTLIGCCSLKPFGAPGRFNLGYWIGRSFWGQGFATEAAQTVIDYGFVALKAEAIDVDCRVVNEASRRVIRKCGFHFIGSGMIDTISSGRVASEHFVMDRRCWNSLKAWGRA